MRELKIDASQFFPEQHSLPAMREASLGCRGCDLYRMGTQTVFGEGKPGARVFLIGEQPGNEEDLDGRPFVGPAGRLLNEALQAAGIEREDAYVTNVVKHFKHEVNGGRRLHKKPNASEIVACLPWLKEEIAIVKPRVLVMLGATAAQSLLGKTFRVTQQRGQAINSPWAPKALATVHPSSILRQRTSEDRHREMALFIEDLRMVAEILSAA